MQICHEVIASYASADGQSKEIREFCQADEAGEKLLKQAITKLGLSRRACDRILKVARMIANLWDGGKILPEHIAEAVQYQEDPTDRSPDRHLYVET